MRVGSQCDPLIAGDNEPTLGSESPGCGRDTHPSACCRTVPLSKGEMLVGQCGRRLRLKVDHVEAQYSHDTASCASRHCMASVRCSRVRVAQVMASGGGGGLPFKCPKRAARMPIGSAAAAGVA